MRFFTQDPEMESICRRGPGHQTIRIARVQDIAHGGSDLAKVEMFGPQQTDFFTG